MYQPTIQKQLTTQVQQAKVLSFRTGQIFQGKITKLYPNQLATLGIGKMQITAKLEAALVIGQRYWFEVKDGRGLPHVKVITDHKRSSSSDSMLQQLGLPEKKGMDGLLQLFANKQIPFSRETIMTSFQLLTQLQQVNKQGIETISVMLEKGIPLSRETFLAFQSTNHSQSFSELLTLFSKSLQKVDNKIAANLLDFISKMSQSSPVKTTISPITQLLTMYAEGENEDVEHLLHRLKLIELSSSKNQIFTTFYQTVQQSSHQAMVKALWPTGLESGLQNDLDVRSFFQHAISSLSIPAGREGVDKLAKLLAFISPSIEIDADELHTRWTEIVKQPLTTSEKKLVQTLLEQSNQRNSGMVFRTLLSMIGYDYEHLVTRFLQGEIMNERFKQESFKTLLLQVQEHDVPIYVKEQAKQLLARVTSHQLFAQDQIGPFLQLLFHLPLTLGAHKTDLTIKWESRKMDNGELDPSHCRILFYLTLPRLEETIVDVQVQNRVVMISVFNEMDKPSALLELLIPNLKGNLNDQGYQLLSVSWKKIQEMKTESVHSSNEGYAPISSYKGVDFRV
ncbi:hypothetical protein N0O92_02290 [Alkalihalobacillus sp. MEB130]|uniref:hypothetical protein n=1 Tax=Alkalihalobacillus sp. MEB130 TaxID=2976704 RepID=UPI0028DD9105|nr:hypothetical protein [Alkalihalobacillus sp. MEB130]MDT8859044.1 hypothetical protein [Alkalihalobacillus sp. MEB130]